MMRLLLLVLCVLLVVFSEYKTNKYQIFAIVVLLFPILGNSLYYVIYNVEPTLELLLTYTKFLSGLILYYAIDTYLDKGYFTQYDRVMSSLCICYLVAIPLSMYVGAPDFKTYSEESSRFGFKGIISAGNEVTGVLFFISSCLAFKLLVFKRKKDMLLFVLCIISSPILGTKGAVLGIIFVIMAVMLERFNLFKFFVISSFVFSLMSVICYFLYLYVDEVTSAVDLTLAYFTYQFENGAENSIITLLLSGRDQKLEHILDQALEMIPIFLFFGGWNITDMYVEMDYFDLILLFGILGSVIIFIFWSKILIVNQCKQFMTFRVATFLSFLVISATAGHIIYSSLVAVFAVYLSQLYKFHSRQVSI
ncbi:hypothetical protein [Vibrio maritimus]|uniref:hypothetical protein n=1 Tax=Vibrio maritimus TaxID=990268 RepID=UPI003AF30EB3